MTDFGAIPISGNNGVPVWRQGQGECLLYNLDQNNTVYIADDISVQPNSTNSAPLPPNSSVVVDGKHDLFAQCLPGLTATLGRFPGGRNFFNLAKLIVRTLIIEASAGNGLFVYDGSGNLTLAIVATDTNDPQQGILCHAGLTTFNSHGAAITYLSTTIGAFIQYQDKGSNVQGSPILSVSFHSGTEPYGGSGISAGIEGTDPVFGDQFFGTGANIQLSQAFYTRRAIIFANGSSSGGANSPFLQVDAPEQTTAQHAQIQILGATPDGTTRPNGTVVMGSVSGGATLVPETAAVVEIQGTAAGGTLALNTPGSTPPPAVAGNIQLWENNGMLALVNGTGNGGTAPFRTVAQGLNTVTSATFANLAFEAIPAGDANHTDATYEIEAEGFGTWGSTQQALTFATRFGSTAGTVIGSNVVFVAGTFPISTAFFWRAKIKLTCTGNAGTATATWRAKLWVTISSATLGVTQMGGTTTDVTLDGSIAENFGISAEWAATVGAPTITKDLATFTRTT